MRYNWKIFVILFILPVILYAEDNLIQTRILDLKINDLNKIISQFEIEEVKLLKPYNGLQLGYISHAQNEAKALKGATEKLKQYLTREITIEDLKSGYLISELRQEEQLVREADVLLDSLMFRGGKTPTGNKIINKEIREILGRVKKFPQQLSRDDAVELKGALHGKLAIKQRSTEALEFLSDNPKLTEADAIKWIQTKAESLVRNSPDNPFYVNLRDFIITDKIITPCNQGGFFQLAPSATSKLKPTIVDGMKPVRIPRVLYSSYPDATQLVTRSFRIPSTSSVASKLFFPIGAVANIGFDSYITICQNSVARSEELLYTIQDAEDIEKYECAKYEEMLQKDTDTKQAKKDILIEYYEKRIEEYSKQYGKYEGEKKAQADIQKYGMDIFIPDAYDEYLFQLRINCTHAKAQTENARAELTRMLNFTKQCMFQK